jgi:ATP-binding cassette, subfamily B, multidrug efflux pump
MNQARRIRDYFARYRVTFGAGMLFLVLTQTFALTIPQFLRGATDGILAADYDLITESAVGLIVVAILGAACRICSRILIFNSGRRVEMDVRNDVFAHLCALPPSYFNQTPSGQILSRAINDLQQVRLLLGPGILNLSNTTLVYVVVVPLLISTDPGLALACLAVLPALVVAGQRMGRKMYEYSRASQDRLGTLSNKVQENLGGLMTVRVYGREDAERAQFETHNQAYFETNMRLARLRGFLFPTMGLFGAFGGVVLVYLGGQRMMSGEMTAGDFVQFNAYLAALTWPTIAMGWMISLIQRGMAAMSRINEIFTTNPSLMDGPGHATDISGAIQIDNLTFTYPGASTPALQEISLTIEPGEVVVVVGRTGSGKSTLLKALARMLEVPAGTIRLDDHDVLDVTLETARSAIAYAPQEAFLFSRSIRDNIVFGEPAADSSQISTAVTRAGLDSDLDGFPEGLDTMVGERGITLSGGQRQRTALARALLLEGPILLLDDTLAAVDTETEARILEGLEQVEGRTTILVTHRLAGAAGADRIVVMDEGRIAEQGTEPELIELDGIYAQMHRRQRLRRQIEHSGPSRTASHQTHEDVA